MGSHWKLGIENLCELTLKNHSGCNEMNRLIGVGGGLPKEKQRDRVGDYRISPERSAESLDKYGNGAGNGV